jgi:hypothetical protein
MGIMTEEQRCGENNSGVEGRMCKKKEVWSEERRKEKPGEKLRLVKISVKAETRQK